MIPLWSDSKPEIEKILASANDIEWSDLSYDDKVKMWKYLENHLFSPTQEPAKAEFYRIKCHYRFYSDIFSNDRFAQIVVSTVDLLNEKYKRRTYASSFLEFGTFDSACEDFHRIFMEQDRDVVFELFTLFSRITVNSDGNNISKNNEESEQDFEKRIDEEQYARFDIFAERLSEVFNDFGINYKLSRDGFITAEEPKVIEEIYQPVLKKLSASKWSDVNRDFRDAFDSLRKDKTGSSALTHALSSLQGFLQILVYGKTGKGSTSGLILEAIKKGIIPDDDFSKKIIKDLNSYWARERQDKGDPHPKKEYATKKQAKLVISLVMVFIDYIL